MQGVLSDAETSIGICERLHATMSHALRCEGSLPSRKWHAGGIVRIMIGRQEGGTTNTGELPGPSTSPLEEGDQRPPRDVGSPNLSEPDTPLATRLFNFA